MNEHIKYEIDDLTLRVPAKHAEVFLNMLDLGYNIRFEDGWKDMDTYRESMEVMQTIYAQMYNQGYTNLVQLIREEDLFNPSDKILAATGEYIVRNNGSIHEEPEFMEQQIIFTEDDDEWLIPDLD